MAEILPYKHAIAPYGTAMAGFPSQIAYGGWQEIRHAIPPWRLAIEQHWFYLIVQKVHMQDETYEA